MKAISKQSYTFRWLLWLVLSFAIVALFSLQLSPLHSGVGADSVMFRLIGECWLRGDLPYASVFDNKGPILYAVNMLGALLGGRVGVFLILVVYYALCIEFLYKIGLFITNKVGHIFVCILCFTIYFFFTVQETNNTETWSILFLLIPLYVYFSIVKNGSASKYAGFVLGLCFGVLCLIRLNNTLLLDIIVIVLLIKYLKSKEYSVLFRHIGLFFLGTFAVVVPFTLFFYFNGVLDDYYYCQFTFNIQYVKVWKDLCSYTSPMQLFLIIAPLLGVVILSTIFEIKNGTHYYAITVVYVLLFALHYVNSSGFVHYTALLAPVLFVSLLLLSKSIKCLSYLLFICLALSPFYYGDNYKYYGDIFSDLMHEVDYSKFDIVRLCESIPEHERKEIYTYNINHRETIIYSLYSVSPKFRVISKSEDCAKVDSKMRIEIQNFLKNNRPLWVVTRKWDNSLFTNVIREYDLVCERNGLMLYRLKDTITDENR